MSKPTERIRRSGIGGLRVLAALLVLGAIPFLAGSWLAGVGPPSGGIAPLTCPATRGRFVHLVTAKGEVQSALNVDVRCEVRARRGSWLRILEVVPDGTRVEPGDLLVQLDSSALEQELVAQRIVCERARAEVARSRNVYEAALTARDDYLEGEYALQRQEADLALLVAENRVQRARQSLQASQKLADRGFITKQQLHADQYALEAAETELRMAQLRLEVLEQCTKRRRLGQLEGAVAAAKARLAAAEANYQLHLQEQAELEDQIRKCTIRAPVAGTVVLNHLHHHDHSHMVQPGELTMPQRVLVRLPDVRHMQVKAKIDEDKVALIQPGLPATIRLEAFPDTLLSGKLLSVNSYPDPEDQIASGIKRYETSVSVESPLEGMRPGMTAEVNIRVQLLEDQLQIPESAVVKSGGKAYCITPEKDQWRVRELALGPANGLSVVVLEGLEDGQEVVLGAAAYRHEAGLPE
ncbi:MAG: efflux RND transporter periplasmic adaptor subunit [Thermoguttaceae bacterium]